MATLVAEDDEGEEERRALLVAGEEGISRVAVGRLLEELFEGSWRRSRMRCTRDSWVQTEQDGSCIKIPSTSAPEKAVDDKEDLRSLAPLASEEEFCSGKFLISPL
ncbi:pleckstrin y domain-containing family G member 4B [Trichonephila inaurata madagascariensis]|uniref:Pleckstrin y domain-containing family G member 4B n=2 Tax=Trichonephila TaxID=2585208 RepID=A0A8X7CSK3_9ARAC|nr:pleckstrin y domain-containing family G member 4B [Trichonephila inaurata madagascariensis]